MLRPEYWSVLEKYYLMLPINKTVKLTKKKILLHRLLFKNIKAAIFLLVLDHFQVRRIDFHHNKQLCLHFLKNNQEIHPE